MNLHSVKKQLITSIGHGKSEYRMDGTQSTVRQIERWAECDFVAVRFNIRQQQAFAQFLCRIFQACIDPIGLPIELMLLDRIGKGRTGEGKNLSSKSFFFSHLAFA